MKEATEAQRKKRQEMEPEETNSINEECVLLFPPLSLCLRGSVAE